jgi:arginine-tRNA-protein transferase
MYDIEEFNAFTRKKVSLLRWEKLLAEGWDRVGNGFFRQRYYYDPKFPNFGRAECMPLRYNLTLPFRFNKNQQKILRRNEDLKTIIRPLTLDDEQFALFDRWEGDRFGLGTPLEVWVVSEEQPFHTHQVCVYQHDTLVAVSYFDIAHKAQYSTIAAYEPTEQARNLGTFTLLKEIEYALKHKRKYHHPGYAYFDYKGFDYKKRIANAEYFSWLTKEWKTLKELTATPPVFQIDIRFLMD